MTSKKEDKVSLIGLAVLTLEFIPGIFFPRPVLNPARWYTVVPSQNRWHYDEQHSVPGPNPIFIESLRCVQQYYKIKEIKKVIWKHLKTIDKYAFSIYWC